MAEARRIFAVVNLRHTFSLDVIDGSPTNAEIAEGIAAKLRSDFGDLMEDVPLIEPSLDVKAVVTSRPIPNP